MFIGPVIAAGILALYGFVIRKTRYSSNLYSGLLFLSSLGGLGPKPWQTPLEFSVQLSSALPNHASTIQRIVSHYMVISYSSDKNSISPEIDKQSWSKLKKAILKRIFQPNNI
jgi:hypothetical protein